jgi:Ca2+-binding EF-hand superfamily protein
MQNSFLIFDMNGDKIVTFDEFSKTILQTLSMKMNKEEVELYYKRL